MKLSMSMIRAYLGPYCCESAIGDDTPTIHGMRFLSEGQASRSREYVYLGIASQYLEDPRYADAVILANGKSHLICRGLDRDELTNEVLSAFDFYNSCEQRLALASAQCASLKEMVRIFEEIFPFPFLVFGIDGSYLAGFREDELADDALRENVLVRKSLGADAIGGRFTDKSGKLQHDLTEYPQITRGADIQTVNRYLCQEGEPVGFVMAFPSDEAEARLALGVELVLASHLSRAAEFTSAHSPHRARYLALADLMMGAAVADDALTRLEKTIELKDAARVVSVRSLAIQNRTQRLLLASEVESALPCLSYERGEEVVFLCADERLISLLDLVKQRFETNSAAAGVSMPLVDLRQARCALEQAVFALDAQEGPGVRYCKDLALSFFVHVLRADSSSGNLLHPALSVLRAYDEKNASELFKTLAAYVRAGCNQTETARQLHVHLNTLKYRLRRISELGLVDFRDQDDLFYLRLSLEIDGHSCALLQTLR